MIFSTPQQHFYWLLIRKLLSTKNIWQMILMYLESAFIPYLTLWTSYSYCSKLHRKARGTEYIIVMMSRVMMYCYCNYFGSVRSVCWLQLSSSTWRACFFKLVISIHCTTLNSTLTW